MVGVSLVQGEAWSGTAVLAGVGAVVGGLIMALCPGKEARLHVTETWTWLKPEPGQGSLLELVVGTETGSVVQGKV